MIDLDAAEECALAMAQDTIEKAIRESGLTRKAVAEEMGRAGSDKTEKRPAGGPPGARGGRAYG